MVKERKKRKAGKSVVFKKKDGFGVSFKARYTRSNKIRSEWICIDLNGSDSTLTEAAAARGAGRKTTEGQYVCKNPECSGHVHTTKTC